MPIIRVAYGLQKTQRPAGTFFSTLDSVTA